MHGPVFTLFLLLFLSASFAQASSENPCNDILLNQIETTVRDLAQMRFDLDVQLSQGKETLVTRALVNGFERKQNEALVAFASNGLTAAVLISKIQNEIKKLQGVHFEDISALHRMKQAQSALTGSAITEVLSIGKLSVPVSRAAQTVLSDGKLILVGGNRGGNLESDRSVQLINPRTGDDAEKILELEYARDNAKIWALPDGSVLVAGGGSQEIELISADLKTSEIFTWGATQVLNASQTGFLNDGTLLIVGEEPYSNPLKTYVFYHFDPVSKDLKELGRIDGFEEGKAISILPDGTVIMSGGMKQDTLGVMEKTLVSTIEKVNAFAIQKPPKKWYTKFLPTKLKYGVEVIGDLGEALYYQRQIVLNDGRILMVGGYNTTDPKSDVRIFDPVLKTYETIGKLKTPRTSGYELTLLRDGRVLVVGGLHDLNPVAGVEIIDAELGTIEELIDLMQARNHPAVTVISDTEVIISGGAQDQGPRRLGGTIELIEKLKVGFR